MKSEIKLPKQWKHWCADMKLGVHGKQYSKSIHHWFYLKGRGRYWRVNCYGMFQCGDTYEDFDRWARCDIEEVEMPKTREEFRKAVRQLLDQQTVSALERERENENENE